MKYVNKAIFFKPTLEQESYLHQIKNTTGKSISEIVRELIQEAMQRKTQAEKPNLHTAFSIKTYHLLKQFVKDNHANAENTIELANSITEEILETL